MMAHEEEVLAKAFHDTETIGAWWEWSECDELAQAIAPVVRDMLAKAWDEGAKYANRRWTGQIPPPGPLFAYDNPYHVKPAN